MRNPMHLIVALLGLMALGCPAASAQEADSILVSNAVLHYSVQGQGQPILLLSGGPGISSESLSHLNQRLSARYRCILFEQRGTGRSHTAPLDSTTINLNQAMDDITQVLRRLKIEKVIIVGHSWGAMLATSYAINHPQSVAKLVLIGPGPLDMSGYSLLADNIKSRASKAELLFMKAVRDSIDHHAASAELLKSYDKTFVRLLMHDALIADSLRDSIKATNNSAMLDLMLQDLARNRYDLKPGLSRLRIPMLVVCGRQDPVGVFPTIAIKDLNKTAKICWIEKSGHFPWVEAPEQFYSEVLKFLE